jgi:hypothetical protein
MILVVRHPVEDLHPQPRLIGAAVGADGKLREHALEPRPLHGVAEEEARLGENRRTEEERLPDEAIEISKRVRLRPSRGSHSATIGAVSRRITPAVASAAPRLHAANSGGR